MDAMDFGVISKVLVDGCLRCYSPMVNSNDILDENMTDRNKSKHFLNGLFAVASVEIALYFTTDMTMGTWAPTCSFKLTI